MVVCVLLAFLEISYLYDYVASLEDLRTEALTFGSVFSVFKYTIWGMLSTSFFALLAVLSFLEARKQA